MNKKDEIYSISSFYALTAILSMQGGSPSRVCKERSDGIAIVRTFQPPLHLSKPQVRNRVTYDPLEAKACDGQKKTPLNVMSFFCLRCPKRLKLYNYRLSVLLFESN